MAPVMARLRGADTDRAQLLLVGALSLAIALVAVALVLNSAIYTHNLASRHDNAADNVVTFSRDVRASAGEHLDYENRHNGSNGYGTVGNAYVGGVATLADTVNDRAAVDVAATRVSHVPDSRVRGVRVVDDTTGAFVPRTDSLLFGSDEWVVAHQVRVRSFDITVPESDPSFLEQLGLGEVEDALEDPLGATDTVFVVEFTDDVDSPSTGETWRVLFYDDAAGDPSVAVHEVGTSIVRTCTVEASTAPEPLVLEMTEARFGGQSCAPLSFVDDLPDTYSVRYYNGDRIEGTYELFADVPVDGPSSERGVFTDGVDDVNYGEHCAGPTFYEATASDYPRVVPALYATDLEVRYDGPDVGFVGNQRVAPGEAGPDPETPRIQSVVVTDTTPAAGNAAFDVDASVTDPNGDLSSVTVAITDGSGDTDDSTFPVSGATGSVSFDFTDDENDSPYLIRVTVADPSKERTVVQTHLADGVTAGCPA